MRSLRRLLIAPVLVGAMFVGSATPSFAFIHVTIPGDDCATKAAVTPGDNPVAHTALVQAGVPLPAGNVTNAPTTCPAP